MLRTPQLDPLAPVPLYRQLYEFIRAEIGSGVLSPGEKIPPTRDLASQLGLNRTTVSAAYSLLESEGWISGQVGRGSFVSADAPVLSNAAPTEELISFASSRPAESQFPLAEFQATVREVTSGAEAGTILQLGSPAGYAPLREHLLEAARREGTAAGDDEVLITSGCQQALDLIERVLAGRGETVVIEDPVYHGQKNVFLRGNTRLVGVPVTRDGIDMQALSRALLAERPRLLLLTPNFQNPTGTSLSLHAREAIVRLARETGTLLVENDIYGELRYRGTPLPSLKALDPANVVLIRSFSKIAFPGLRVGWVLAPAAIVSRMTEARQWCDLHTDQLSQAILFRFAQSGRLAAHLHRVRERGTERLAAALSGCAHSLPSGTTWTTPEGGMSLWVELPAPLDAAELLVGAEREGVTYLPGSHFAVGRARPGTLRLSFGGLSPEQIAEGLARLGRACTHEFTRARHTARIEAAPAVV